MSDFLIADGVAGDKVLSALSMLPLSLLFLTVMDIHLNRFSHFFLLSKLILFLG